MGTFLLRRLIQTVLLLLIISAFVFFLINLAPGGPFDALVFGSPRVSQAHLERLNQLIGLDKPWYIRYFSWLRNVVVGDWGTSWGVAYGQPVLTVIAERLPATVLLMGTALLLSLLIALPIGIYSALRQYSWVDYVVTALSFFGIAMPTFWFGIMLIIIFAVVLKDTPFQLPTGGMMTPGMGFDLGDRVRHLILPVAVLSLFNVAQWSRFMRSSMLEILHQDYMRTARAKGLREQVVILKHGLRNALIPIITIIGLEIPALVSGAVVTEFIFSWPGMGQVFFQAVFASDWPVVQGIVVITACVVILSNLLADILYAVADPRIRYS